MAEIICQNSRTFVVNWNYLAEFTHFCRELIIIDKIHALLSKILSFYISLKNLYEKSVKIIAQYKQVLLSSVFSMQKIFIIQQKWFLWTNEAVKWILSIVRITVPAEMKMRLNTFFSENNFCKKDVIFAKIQCIMTEKNMSFHKKFLWCVMQQF